MSIFKRELLFIIVLLCLCIKTLFGSFENVTVSPLEIASGNISGFHFGDTSIPFLRDHRSFISLNYLYPYGISELSREDVSIKTKILGLASLIRVLNFGNSTYRENTFQYNVSLFNVKDLSIESGISVFYLRTEFESNWSFGFDMSAAYKIFENLESVCYVKNIYAYDNDEIDIPLEMYMNLRFAPIAILDVYFGIEKDDIYKVNVKTGISYKPINALDISMGYNFNPGTVNTGFSINFEKYKFSYAVSYHFDLEYSHSVGIIYEL